MGSHPWRPAPAFGSRNTWDQIQKRLMEVASKPAELNSKICLSPLTFRKIHHLARVSFGEIGEKNGKMQYGLRVREFQVVAPKKLVALSPSEVKAAAEKERELPAMADGQGDDDSKGDRIMQALRHMMNQVVWVYGDYYRVDADALILAMEEKRLTIAQRETFSAYKLEECIDKSMQSFFQRLFEQVTNLEVDLSYAEEKDAYGRGTMRFFYSPLLRCFQEVEAEMAMYEHRRKVEEQKKRKEAEAKRRKGKKGAEDSTALAPPHLSRSRHRSLQRRAEPSWSSALLTTTVRSPARRV